MNFQDNFNGKISIGLSRIDLKNSTNKESTLQPFLKDYYEYSFENRALIIEAFRQINAQDQLDFKIITSYKIVHEFKETVSADSLISKFDIKEEIKNNINYFIPDEYDRLSLIISNLLSSFGGSPFVTIPFAQFE